VITISFGGAGFYQFNFGGGEGVAAEDAGVDFRLPRRAILPARGQTLLHQALNRRTLRRRRGGDGKLDLINTRLQPGDRIRANEKPFQRFVRRRREISGGG